MRCVRGWDSERDVSGCSRWWEGVLSGGVPFGVLGLFPGLLARRGGGVPAWLCAVSVCAGVGVVCESVVVRGARPRAGGRGGKGVRGKPGKPRALGGFPGSPRDACRFPRAAGRRGMRVCRAERGALDTLPLVIDAEGTGVDAFSTVIGAAGSVVAFWGRQEWGSGGEHGTGPLGVPGGFRVLPQCVSGLVSPSVCLLV